MTSRAAASAKHNSEDPARNSKVEDVRTIRGIDLFAGAGGFSRSAINVGIDIVAAVENDRSAARTYHRNIQRPCGSAVRLITKDILTVEPFSLFADQEIPGIDIILGGPPCQGFSTHRLKDAGVDDPRNGLLIRYFDFVKAFRPKLFIVENVPGLLWPRHAKYLTALVDGARDAGYVLAEPLLLNAKDYGVPQNRKRVFLLGVRSDFEFTGSWPPPPTHCRPDMPEQDRQGRQPWVTAEVAFAEIANGDPNAIHMNSSLELVRRFEATPVNGGSRKDNQRFKLRCHYEHDGHSDVYGRIDPSKPAPTMTTACINPSKGRFVHPTEHRGISLRHAARLQTFPDDFVFEGGLMSGGMQVGNAVPVKLGEAILREIVAALAA